ncbi:unnamed protein product, partial [marine sediment metagenome]
RPLFVLLLLPTFLLSVTLKERFREGSNGDYIVIEQNKTYTLLNIHTKNEDEIILEEISIPSHLASSKEFKWKEWVRTGAAGHTSWIMYEVDFENDRITESYSFTRKAFASIDSNNSFLLSLLKISLDPIPRADRRRIGLAPPQGEEENRKLWNPPQYIEGKRIKKPAYDAFGAIWPKDNSELSEKEIELYFDQTHQNFPFPYWIQISGNSLSYKIRTLDSGKNLQSPFTELPRRAPTILGTLKKQENSYMLTVKCPSFIQD